MQSPGQRRPVQLHLQNPSINHTETGLDIIALHGLDTKSPDTWMWKTNPEDHSECGVNWLADETMLPKAVAGRARIFTCDWPADLLEPRTLVEHSFQELSSILLAGIQRVRSRYANDRPIIFVASCLGGIILIKALVQAKGDYRGIKTSTRGIIFLAAPFRGTSFEDVANWVELGLGIWGSTKDRRVTRLVDLIKGLTPQLDELRRDFIYLAVNQHYTVHTFYEKGYTDLYRNVSYLPNLLCTYKKQLVDKTSAILDIDPHPLSFDRTHVLMNKFSSPSDVCYQMLKIVRISRDELEMDQCYINLAIVQRIGEGLHPPGNESADKSINESSFSIGSRLKVGTPDQKLQVKLTTLFESSCKLCDDSWGRPSRILIQGRAGIGKTTLCKKIVHDFTRKAKWTERFARVFWVPLRELKKEGHTGYRLEDIFCRLYFNDAKDGGALASNVCDAVSGTASYDSLFILDGLDEVSELLDPGHAAFNSLIKLLNCPNAIITTRPHAKLPSIVKVDLELETIGFYPYQYKD
ncbi:hypothetical protein NUW58_g7194 [Xylaria curta]|uniref:Uncharacterized protein n=1 Tax=Xylaria curta TaxID=42375 RepID=A0ACC1NJL4_9PEZI|nr:hypothetical protein NUW58_g7194 [Xylaria curta]